ncbi:MAG: DNA sulfur modification protein DndD [Thermoplasmata archaeon]|nr:MAG: DNA sulfur modification protein DndD [Thermoplasmata archaeon]
MRVQKIKIKNFGVYHGINEITLPLDEGKNICLIDGNNGYGKTTFYRALWYCLYGIRHKYKERLDFMNRYALSQGDLRTSVEVHFTYRGKHYQMTRSLIATRENIERVNDVEESVTLLEDGVPVVNIENRINEILPRDASQFFFFDGEDIAKYASLENTEATKEAIEMVLGIPAIRNAIQDLYTIEKGLHKEIKKETKDNKDQQRLMEQEEEISSKIESCKSKLEEAKKEKEKLSSLKMNLQQRLEEHEVFRPIFEEKENLERRKKELEEKLKLMKREEKEIFERMPYLILKPIIEKLEKGYREKLLREKDIQERAILYKAMIKEIDNILSTGKCLCGNRVGRVEERILKGKKEKYEKYLREYGEFSIEKLIEKQQKLNKAIQIIKEVEIKYKEFIKKKGEISFELDEIETELKSIDKKLGDVPDRNEYKHLKEEYEKVNAELIRLDEDIKWFEEEYKRLQIEKEEIESKILEIKIRSPRVEKLRSRLKLVRNSLKALNEYLEKLRYLKVKKIEEEATRVFRELTNKKGVFDRVRINDDFTIQIIDRDGEVVDNEKISAGEKQILALSFIAGLMRSTDKEAPVIMDTPFGRLDHEHKTNVMKFLHKLANQVVILATDEDINEENIDLIAPYIGKRYEIRFLPDKMSSIIVEAG